MKVSFFISTLSTLLLSATSVVCSQEELQQFFKEADKGTYEIIIDSIKKSPPSPQEIVSLKDSEDNSMLTAAIKAYPEAIQQYGDKKATQTLFELLTLILSKLSKDQAVKLLNTENKSGFTALLMAAQVGSPLKIIDLLHSKGATVVNKENKKASTYIKDPYTKKIVQEWENVEGDSIIIPTGERIK